MSRRVLLMVLALCVVVGAGALAYVYSTPKTLTAAEDCGDKPAPKVEFAMAAECDAAPPQPAAPAPVEPR